MTAAKKPEQPHAPSQHGVLPLAKAPVLAKRLTETRAVHVGGTESPAQKALILAAMQLLDRAPSLVWLVRDEKEARTHLSLLKFWLPGVPIRVFGETPTPVILDHLLRGRPGIAILSLDAFDQRLPDQGSFLEKVLTVRSRSKLSPQELVEHLSLNGYEADRTADTPGVYARRGGITDIYSPDQDSAVRIEFDGDTVVLVAPLDPLSKKLGSPLPHLTILPLEIEVDRAAGSLFDYLHESLLFVYADPDLLQQSHPSWTTIEKRLEAFRRLTFSIFETEDAPNFDLRSAKFYHYRLKDFAKDVGAMHRDGWRMLVATIDRERMLQFLKANGLQPTMAKHPLDWLGAAPGTVSVYPVTVDTLSTLAGFSAEAGKNFFITDKEIFGLKVLEDAGERVRSVDMALLQEISTGDFVVHLDHGIGKFQGLIRQQMNGYEREYFVLEYAEGDKLFVPVDAADKIAKYIGGPNPKLHRLSGASWTQLTNRIKEDAMKVARELLTLHAQRELAQAPALDKVTPDEKRLVDSFPYDETPDQKKTIQEVLAALSSDKPMDRLVCGDVGFGKTEVAIRAAFRAVMNGVQVAVLSPTTILTQQHFDTFSERLKGFPVTVDLLSRFRSDEEQAKTVAKLNVGEVDIIIGTHRLLSDDIRFKKLGLVIIDEEQRFGVRHKEVLLKLRTQVHVLTLSATPIPRTLNFALSGIKDLSVIETPPEGRLPIETAIKPYAEELVQKAIAAELKRKGQVYYVYNNVETISLAAKKLRDVFPKARVAHAHGQMGEAELSKTMEEFDHHEIDILVCSTIIENGLDLPNVNTMIVDHAQKFGLSQLYQLRGRVGRGSRQAFAYFLYHTEKLTESPKRRLKALAEARDLGSGLQLALKDLEIRGTGNLLGKAQHGHIAAVGLNLYTRLLAQAVEELRTGIPQKAPFEVTIDLPIPVGIPPTLVPREAKRIQLYRLLARLKSKEEIHEFKKKELMRRATSGKLPTMVENLLKLLDLKIRCQRAHIKSIQLLTTTIDAVERRRMVVTFAQDLTPERIERVVKHNQAWDFSLEVIKIDVHELGADWLKELARFATVMADDKREPAAPKD
ncbi:MAG: transcription-repair coupling factor [Candidatus Kerfeldbacteria bacterium]|nr:transcription-repair coupling factor [Candidatus Kerfeldbacteria bacterium]